MPGSTPSWLRAAVVLALATHVAGQKCYYPNGAEAAGSEKPCSSAEGSACCPDTWECLDNGLCHNPNGNLYGRYSCTDKDWNSPGCPSNMCTYDKRAAGGEGIAQCSNHDNQWCCDADRTNVNCCQEWPEARPFFALQDGRAYATIGRSTASSAPALNTITGLAVGTGSGSSPSQTSAPTSAANSGTPVTSATRITSLQTSVSSGSAGVETLTITNVITQLPDPTASTAGNDSSSSGGGSSNNIGLIVGCAVGIPLALALVGIVIWMLRKRRQQKANPYKETPELDHHDSPSFAGGAAAKLGKKENATYRHSRPGTAEIDGQPVGPGRPISAVKGRAELDSGHGFQPGHNVPFAPDTVGLGGGSGNTATGNPDRSTWGSVPPQYSPAANQPTFSQYADVSELDGTSAMAPMYQAYRPPAELPTVKTPPEDVEKQILPK